MIDLIEKHREEIAALCRRHGVKRLELFGSAASEDFNNESDIDFFVEFLEYDSPTIVDQWFGLQEQLEAVLHRPVDLVSVLTAKNRYFLEMANEHRVSLYAA